MNLTSYNLNLPEQIRLISGVKAALAIPFIDSLEDFIWEGVFCYTKEIPVTDYLLEKRKKLLFDVTQGEVGWSAKSLQCGSFKEGSTFELVIQRANILKKRTQLGFPTLTLSSPTADLGAALLTHWHQKIDNDAVVQGVTDKRICVLLKTKKNTHYAYFEEELARYRADELMWSWATPDRVGLHGIRKSDGFCVYKWYHGQTQFFERFQLNEQTFFFDFVPRRIAMDKIVTLLNSQL